MSPPLLVFAPGLRPDPDPAREWVRAELAKHEYQPTLLERITGWVFDLLGRILSQAGRLGSLNPKIALVMLIALVVVLAVVLARLRPAVSRRQQQPGAVFPDQRISAAEHRARAERAIAGEDWDDAVVESMRAIAVGLVERELVDDELGATAREVTDRAGRLFATLSSRLREAADVFDAVLYGDHRAGRDTALGLLELEATVRATRPAETAAGPVMAVPR